MCARLFKSSCPLNIGRLVETRLQLDEHHHLFPCLGGADQMRGDA